MTNHENVLRRMREEWEQRAREDARRYIADRESQGIHFSLSGCRDAFRILEELHPWLREDMRVLEIGCGIGRLMQFFAVLFAEVHGVDVAPAMIEQAKSFLARFPNAHPALGDGQSLSIYGDASFDLVLSHAVFQHVPDLHVIGSYVGEGARVLAPGGLFKFLVKTGRWEGQGDEHDTWHGVEVGMADVEGWCRDTGLELVRAYSAHDPQCAWVLLRKP